MKANPGIVQHEGIQHEQSIRQASAAFREALVAEQGVELRFTTARQQTARRRLELGRVLVAARASWPVSGPRARGWGEMLARVGLDQDVALDAMRYAGYVASTGRSRNLPGDSPDALPTRRQAGMAPPLVHHRPLPARAELASDAIRLLCLWWLLLVQEAQ